MKQELKTKAQQLVDKILIADYTSSDVGMLLITLRREFEYNPDLLDITNFIAHAEGRDRGVSYKYTSKFFTKLISTFENGGSFTIPKQLFERKDIFNKLTQRLKDLKILKEEALFNTQRDQFIGHIMELISDVEIKLKEPKVKKCILKKDGNKVYVCVNIYGKHGVLNPAATHRLRLFD